MADFKRELLTPQEVADAIRGRLEGLERDHLGVSLDVEVAGPGGNPPQEARKAQLEDIITKLRADLKAAEQAAGAGASRSG